jgi:hypothetical protein
MNTDTNIELDNNYHLNRFKTCAPSASYIAGFIDGDGCIFIRKIKDGYQSGITITQCRTNILQVVRFHFGGSVTSSANRSNKVENIMDGEYYHKYNARNEYNLLIRSNEYQLLLEYIKDHIIIKEKQIYALYEFNKIINSQNNSDKKTELYEICSKKREIFDYNFSKLNIEYIQGIFDAEGCIYINKRKFSTYKISISQKNHPDILQEIQKFLGFGTVSNFNLHISKKSDCLSFMQLVKNGVIVKYNQVCAFETFLQTNDTNIKEQMYKICNEEKHKIEVFNNLNQNEHGKTGYNNAMQIKKNKQLVCDEIIRNDVYKQKSKNMIGSGNHNYGKQFSDETKKKMSVSIRNAKGGVSDETIIAVRKLIREGKKNIEIQELLNLSRHTVTRIKCGIIVCRTEEVTSKPVHTQEENNILKRKIRLDEILFVIDKCINDEIPNKILAHLIEQRAINNIKNELTIDIIKNLKRNIQQNKMPIYKHEVSSELYQHYVQLINGKYAV